MKRETAPVMLITGGSGSIGREIASQALAGGWSTIVQGRSPGKVRDLVASLQCRHDPDRVEGLEADITEPGAVEELVRKAAARFGRIDAVVDCLVTGPEQGKVVGPFAETTPEAYLPFAEQSLVYLERLAFSVLPYLKQTGGCLVAFASDAGVFPAPRQVLIGAARAGTIGLVKNLAAEVAADGVRVHCVSPGFVDGTVTAEKLALSGSDRLEKARRRAGLGLPTPEDIAPLVLFLCGDGARRMTGQVISVNGGLNV